MAHGIYTGDKALTFQKILIAFEMLSLNEIYGFYEEYLNAYSAILWTKTCHAHIICISNIIEGNECTNLDSKWSIHQYKMPKKFVSRAH